ncbi:hypothetical protein WDU94_003897 [Cyamophila willieti]
MVMGSLYCIAIEVSSQLGSRVSSLDNLLSSSSPPPDTLPPASSARTTKIESAPIAPKLTNEGNKPAAAPRPAAAPPPPPPPASLKKKVHFGSPLSKSTPQLPTKYNCPPKPIDGPPPLGEILTRSIQRSPSKFKSELSLSSSACPPLSVKLKDVPEPKSPIFKEQISSVVAKTKDLDVKAATEVDIVPSHRSPPQSIEQTDRSTPTLKTNQISLSHENLKKIVSESNELLDVKQDTPRAKDCRTVSYVPYSPFTLMTPYFYPAVLQHNPLILTPVPSTSQPHHPYLTTAEINPSQATQTSLSFEEYCKNSKSISGPTTRLTEPASTPLTSEQPDNVMTESNALQTNSYRTNLQLFGYRPVTSDHTKPKPKPESPSSGAGDTTGDNVYHCRPVSVASEEEYYSFPSDMSEKPPPVNYSTLPRTLSTPSWQEIFANTPPLQLPDPSSSLESALSIDPIVGSRAPSARPLPHPNKVGIAFSISLW